jgi:hypothetical protein
MTEGAETLDRSAPADVYVFATTALSWLAVGVASLNG